MKNKVYVFIGVFGLILVYVFQMQLFYNPFDSYQYNPQNPVMPEIDTMRYVLSKSFRYLLNDALALLVIWGLFENKRYMRFAVIVLLFGFLILLPIYLFLSMNYFFETQAFLNHLHRLVLNPVLMMLLIPAFYYQASLKKK